MFVDRITPANRRGCYSCVYVAIRSYLIRLYREEKYSRRWWAVVTKRCGNHDNYEKWSSGGSIWRLVKPWNTRRKPAWVMLSCWFPRRLQRTRIILSVGWVAVFEFLRLHKWRTLRFWGKTNRYYSAAMWDFNIKHIHVRKCTRTINRIYVSSKLIYPLPFSFHISPSR